MTKMTRVWKSKVQANIEGQQYTKAPEEAASLQSKQLPMLQVSTLLSPEGSEVSNATMQGSKIKQAEMHEDIVPNVAEHVEQEEDVAEIVAEVAEILSDKSPTDASSKSAPQLSDVEFKKIASVQRGGRWRNAGSKENKKPAKAVTSEESQLPSEAAGNMCQSSTARTETQSKKAGSAVEEERSGSRRSGNLDESSAGFIYFTGGQKESHSGFSGKGNPSSIGPQTKNEKQPNRKTANGGYRMDTAALEVSEAIKERQSKREEKHGMDDTVVQVSESMKQRAKDEASVEPEADTERSGTDIRNSHDDEEHIVENNTLQDIDNCMKSSEEDDEHAIYCCKCSQAYLVNVDLLSYTSNFSCADLGRACKNEIVEEDVEDENLSEKESAFGVAAAMNKFAYDDGDEQCSEFFAVCDRCGETRVTCIDFMGLGLGFTCSEVAEKCVGLSEEASVDIPAAIRGQPVDRDPLETDLEGLGIEEKRDLFARYGMQRLEEKATAKDIQHGVSQLFAAQPQQQRYRNDEVVTRKGERFIQVKVSLDPGPGCQLGGILGWRSKAGRRGLGIKKMDKEEADRICMSNKQRSHTKTASKTGDTKYTFENKWSQHTAGSTQGQAPNSLGKSSTVCHGI